MLQLQIRPFKLFAIAGLLLLGSNISAFSQSGSISLTDLSAFRDVGKSWEIAGDVEAELGKANTLKISKGTGVLVNRPDKKVHGTDLYTVAEYGDMELELEYMMAPKSNSGIYLQDRYEIQLRDSWGDKDVSAGSNGGIYQRWDTSRPAGQQGYEGHAPRQNASRAPGLWQHLKISFQAPKFDAGGRKIANANVVRLELNGVTIHEGVELSGPTRGGKEEKATGPLRLQGDHGAVAFRNIKISGNVKQEAISGSSIDPILIEAPVNTVLRSFMDLPGQGRVVHAVNVGSPEKVHYTYDMDRGNIVQIWRGKFLDATPMWHNRGDGSSRPTGMVQRFGKPAFFLVKLSSPKTAWITDTAGSGFRPKGYILDDNDRPTFKYRIGEVTVSDAIRVLDNGQGLRREVTVQNAADGFYARLAEGNTIEDKGKGLYVVDGKSYYLQVDETNSDKPTVRDVNGRKELIMPVHNKLNYTILF